MPTYLSREAILAARDLPERDVAISQWNGSVRIRALTKADSQALRDQASTDVTGPDGLPTKQVDTKKFELLLFVHCVTEPKFAEDDVAQLREKSAGAIDTVIRGINELNGWTKEALTAAERAFPGEPDAAPGVQPGAADGKDGGAAQA